MNNWFLRLNHWLAFTVAPAPTADIPLVTDSFAWERVVAILVAAEDNASHADVLAFILPASIANCGALRARLGARRSRHRDRQRISYRFREQIVVVALASTPCRVVQQVAVHIAGVGVLLVVWHTLGMFRS
jgi:hypothetical protein